MCGEGGEGAEECDCEGNFAHAARTAGPVIEIHSYFLPSIWD
jgi:hypothetical protein